MCFPRYFGCCFSAAVLRVSYVRVCVCLAKDEVVVDMKDVPEERKVGFITDRLEKSAVFMVQGWAEGDGVRIGDLLAFFFF